MSWTALYNGLCERCDDRIRADVDQVEWAGTEVVHVECPDPLETATGVCPTCHLVLPVTGICGTC